MTACGRCGQQHQAAIGPRACSGHVKLNGPDGEHLYGPDGTRSVRPCQKPPMAGLDVCGSHGGRNPNAKAVGEQRAAEAEMVATARKLIPDIADRTKITNPLETLLELASEANAFRESLRVMANELDGRIRYAANGASGEQLRAEVATYRQALKDTTDLLVAIARLDIEKVLARVEARKVAMTIDALQYGCEQAALTDDQKRTVMAGVARHLRSVHGTAA